MKPEKEAREEILSLVKSYAEAYHQKKAWKKGSKINYAGRIYNDAELVNLVDCSLDFWLTAGKWTDLFEKKLADYLGLKYCAFVNSGSSANLCAFMALTSPLLGEQAIKRGDEIITAAAGFPTTVAPIIQFGAIPVFIDITIPQYNIDCSQLENALSNKTKAVMLAHTLGNPFDLSEVKRFCDKHNLWLIEDNCDALGTEYNGQKTGTFGDIGTSSFYPPHHITTGEGGAVYTNNPLLYKIIRSLRDWGRDCICASGQDNLCGHRFDGQFGELPKGYDHKYVYSHFGYNLKGTDMQAAVGCAQLDKLDFFVSKRNENWIRFYELLKPLESYFILPEVCENSNPSWFGFILYCKDGVNRENIVRMLEKNGIQTRMLFAGNITRQPCFIEYKDYRIVGNLNNTDKIMNNAFWIGVYPNITDKAAEYIVSVIKEFLV